MVKKATITISLVEESASVTNKELEEEILLELSKDSTMIPWLKKVEKVTVTGK